MMKLRLKDVEKLTKVPRVIIGGLESAQIGHTWVWRQPLPKRGPQSAEGLLPASSFHSFGLTGCSLSPNCSFLVVK